MTRAEHPRTIAATARQKEDTMYRIGGTIPRSYSPWGKSFEDATEALASALVHAYIAKKQAIEALEKRRVYATSSAMAAEAEAKIIEIRHAPTLEWALIFAHDPDRLLTDADVTLSRASARRELVAGGFDLDYAGFYH